jgi:hypothetical protein
MDQLISYRYSNRIKVGMWLGAAAMIVFVANSSDSYIIRVIPICILAFFWVFFLRRAGIGKLADEVRDCGDRLQIRRGKINEVVWLSRVSLVEASTLGTMNVVRLTFLDDTSLGDQIAFLPRYERGQASWSTEASKLAQELTARINKVRRSSAN